MKMQLLTLLRKNFWLWDPRKGANLVLLAVALLFSISDFFMNFPPAAWGLMLVLMFLLGQAGGASALNTDLQHDNILFLEYLPIRWSWLWLANYLDQFVFNLVFIFFLTWHRLLFFKPLSPPAVDVTDPFSDPILSPLYASRWLLPVALFAFISASFAYTLFWRTFFRTDKAAIVPNLLAGVLFLSWPIAFFTLMHLAPSIADLVPILLLFTFLFSLASFLAFAMPPRYWPRWLRFLTAGLPLITLLFAIEVLVFFASADRWSRLDFSEPELRFNAATFPDASPNPYTLLTVRSFRSGSHTFYWDPSLDSPKYLGRELSTTDDELNDDNTTTRSTSARNLAFVAEFAPRTLWPTGQVLLTMNPDGSSPHQLIHLDNLASSVIENGYFSGRVRRSADGSFYLVLVEPPRVSRDGSRLPRSRENILLAVDSATGAVRKRFAVDRSNYPGYLLSPAGLLLTGSRDETLLPRSPRDPAASSNPNSLPRFRLADLHSDTQFSFTPPARVLCLSPDLTECLCLRITPRSSTEVAHGELLKVNVRTATEDSLLSDQRLGPDIGIDSYEQLFPVPSSLSDEFHPRSDFGLSVNETFTHAVWVSQRRDGDLRRLSLVHIDLKTGRHNTLVDEDQLPTIHITDTTSSTTPRLHLRRFTADSSMFIYQLGGKVIYVDVGTGRVASTIETNTTNSPRFSPSARRFTIQHSVTDTSKPLPQPPPRTGSDAPPSSDRWITECFDFTGTRTPLNAVSNVTTPYWLDDDHIVLDLKDKLVLISADGSTTRQLLPPTP